MTRKSKKYTYTSPAQRELIQWIDDREERSRFWSAAREIVLAGFPDNYGNPLLDDPNNPVTTNEFLEAYELRGKQYANKLVGQNKAHDRAWSILAVVNRFLARIYHGQTTMLNVHRALWFEDVLGIDVAGWVLDEKGDLLDRVRRQGKKKVVRLNNNSSRA